LLQQCDVTHLLKDYHFKEIMLILSVGTWKVPTFPEITLIKEVNLVYTKPTQW